MYVRYLVPLQSSKSVELVPCGIKTYHYRVQLFQLEINSSHRCFRGFKIIALFPTDEHLRLPPTPPSSHGSDSDGSQSPHSLPPLSPGHLQSPHSLPSSSPARLQARTSAAISSSPLLTAPHVSHAQYIIQLQHENRKKEHCFLNVQHMHQYKLKKPVFCHQYAEAPGDIRPFNVDRRGEENFDR